MNNAGASLGAKGVAEAIEYAPGSLCLSVRGAACSAFHVSAQRLHRSRRDPSGGDFRTHVAFSLLAQVRYIIQADNPGFLVFGGSLAVGLCRSRRSISIVKGVGPGGIMCACGVMRWDGR